VRPDVIVAGAGPVGLATAIAAAREGLSVMVLERRATPVDKACGEGILPPGVRALATLGVDGIDPESCTPIAGLRYVEEDGRFAEARLATPGLAARRPALVDAMARRARGLGVELRDGCAVRGFERREDAVAVDTDGGTLEAGILVAADGLHSPLRELAGLARPGRGPRRFGLSQHFRVRPWSDFVEVHLAACGEAYVTPVGPERVGVALLWEKNGGPPPGLDAFPRLAERLVGAEPDSAPRGAGPMAQRSSARVADRLVLVGDAAGYVDAITGEGLSLGFSCALGLAPILARALQHGGSRAALAPYEPIFRREFRRYTLLTRGLLALARRPRTRRRVLRALGRHPGAFERIVDWAVGA